MRWILYVSLALGVLWGGYWFAGSRAVEFSVTRWFEDAANQGVTASYTGISVAGFPNRFDLTITEPHLSDDLSGWGWQAPFAQIFTMTWKPWHLIAALPHEQTILAPDQTITLASGKLEGVLRLHPSNDLALAEVVVEGHDLAATSDQGWTIGATALTFAVIEDPSRHNGQRLGLAVADLKPDPSLTALMPELGETISTLHLDATLALSAPLDRHVGQTRVVIEAIHLADFQGAWGTLMITATGNVTRADDGYAEGRIDIRVEDWRQIPKLAAALGLVLPDMGKSIERGMEVLAKAGDDPEVLDLPLEFKDGQMTLGPLPLGPAPRLNQSILP